MITKLKSALPALYLANDAFPFTINVSVELDGPIDRKALRRSLDGAQGRYPYFSVEVVIVDDQYALAPNPRPFAIFDDANAAVLGGPEAHGHLIAVAAHDRSIDFLAFHGITDGHGFFPFIKTVLYLYLSEVTGETFDAGVVRLPGETPFAPEFVDPYPASAPDSIEPFGRYVPSEVFHLPESAGGSGAMAAYEITLADDAFMKYTRQSDGSPATMVTAFLFKAVQALHPDNAATISCGMAFDRRGVLQVPETCWNVSDVVHLGYEPAMAALPMTTLATVSRGMVFLQSQPENVLVAVRASMAGLERLVAMSHEQRKAALSRGIVERLDADTFNVSYVGRAGFGELERHICGLHIFTNIAGTGILAEFTTLNGRFVMTFLQDFEDGAYARCFCDLLAAENIETTLVGPLPVPLPTLQVPSTGGRSHQ